VSGPRPAQLVEAVLLASSRPLDLASLSSATGLPRGDLGPVLADLAQRYSPDFCGIVLREVAGGYMLATNPSCSSAVERLREVARPAPLSNAAYEVLSCALYHGPLTRAGISSVRGVNSDSVIRSLLERNLLAEVGEDSASPGSPALLDVTEDFLLAAGASSREDFPPLDSLVGEDELSRVRERLTSAEHLS
jgi:segregation and condensation protein B